MHHLKKRIESVWNYLPAYFVLTFLIGSAIILFFSHPWWMFAVVKPVVSPYTPVWEILIKKKLMVFYFVNLAASLIFLGAGSARNAKSPGPLRLAGFTLVHFWSLMWSCALEDVGDGAQYRSLMEQNVVWLSEPLAMLLFKLTYRVWAGALMYLPCVFGVLTVLSLIRLGKVLGRYFGHENPIPLLLLTYVLSISPIFFIRNYVENTQLGYPVFILSIAWFLQFIATGKGLTWAIALWGLDFIIHGSGFVMTPLIPMGLFFYRSRIKKSVWLQGAAGVILIAAMAAGIYGFCRYKGYEIQVGNADGSSNHTLMIPWSGDEAFRLRTYRQFWLFGWMHMAEVAQIVLFCGAWIPGVFFFHLLRQLQIAEPSRRRYFADIQKAITPQTELYYLLTAYSGYLGFSLFMDYALGFPKDSDIINVFSYLAGIIACSLIRVWEIPRTWVLVLGLCVCWLNCVLLYTPFSVK